MESRVCPQCGSRWYSANYTSAWVCERCGTEIPTNEIQGGKSVGIKDSGQRRTFETGAVRDVAEGKGRCDLLPLEVIGVFLLDEILLRIENYIRRGNDDDLFWVLEYIGQTYYDSPYFMFLEVAKHYEGGAKKYAERNWEKGQPLHVYIDSGVRHYLKFKAGLTDEPHLRAFVWNILGAIWTHRNKPEMIDLPFKEDEHDQSVED
jgi:transcription initiation factor TFIIIB Brf1 subunit/transcription initiation factor TFIIB